MTKFITVKLTESQARAILYALVEYKAQETPSAPKKYATEYNAFIQRIMTKIAGQLSSK